MEVMLVRNVDVLRLFRLVVLVLVINLVMIGLSVVRIFWLLFWLIGMV